MYVAGMEIIGVIYGVRLTSSDEYRYVGLTTKSAIRRFARHLQNARAGRKVPFYDWLRKYSVEEVTVDILETISSDRAALGTAEVAWIAKLKLRGDRLLNLTEGGLGPTGVVWTPEQREAARIRNTGRPGLHRFGPEAPFYGGHHTVEQRAKWSKERTGSITGEKNPNFGKFGAEHPAFGRILSPETKQRLAEQKRGELNPRFGKKDSAETLAKKSAAQKGVPKPSSVRSAHTRHHTNKGVKKAECKYCVLDAQDTPQTPSREKQE